MESKSFEPCRIIFCFLTATVVCCAILHTPTHLQDFTLVSRLSVFSSSSANWSTNGMVISTAQPVTNFMCSLWQLAPNYRIRVNTLQPRTKLKQTKLSCWLLLLLVLQAGDIELNPGPYIPKFPCKICSKAAKWGQKCLQCKLRQGWWNAGLDL